MQIEEAIDSAFETQSAISYLAAALEAIARRVKYNLTDGSLITPEMNFTREQRVAAIVWAEKQVRQILLDKLANMS